MNNYIFAFEKLEVWRLAKEFSLETYGISKSFPKEERYGLTSQLNRAAVSIASNIAEGSARKTNKDKAHFYQIAYGSLMEVASLLLIVKDLAFIDDERYFKLREKIHELSNKLNSLHKYQLNSSTTQQLNKSI